LAILALMSVKEVYRYSNASGIRAVFECQAGVWTAEWPIGKKAIVSFAAHKEVLGKSSKILRPHNHSMIVDKCVEMLAGVVSGKDGEKDFRIAFQGRPQDAERYVLLLQRVLATPNWSSDLYEKVGGDIQKVEVKSRRLIVGGDAVLEDARIVEYSIPSLDRTREYATVVVPRQELGIL
jgi:hypothetical protein